MLIQDDEQMRVALESFPRAIGHGVVTWKPHHEDFTALAPADTAALFQRCTDVANAIKCGSGVEKVYIVTTCDGYPNHCHIQLIPRYAGEPQGSRRFVAPRGVLQEGEGITRRIREAL